MTRPSAEGLTDDAWEKALAGEVATLSDRRPDPDGKMRGRGRAFVIVARPWEDVWATVQDHAHFPDFMPNCERTAVLAFEPDKGFKRVTEWVKVVFSTYEYTLDFKLDRAARRVEYRLNKGFTHDVEEIEGGWFLHPLADGRTLVAYTTYVETGSVPGFIADWFQGSSMRDLLGAVRRRTESGGTWKKD
jgi:ribosome-associated toxin RatA of RatAB toxin-antitoxin module